MELPSQPEDEVSDTEQKGSFAAKRKKAKGHTPISIAVHIDSTRASNIEFKALAGFLSVTVQIERVRELRWNVHIEILTLWSWFGVRTHCLVIELWR